MSVINTNYLSLVAQNNLQKSQSALGSAIERLSSGMRINSAKDDAAGQAIANRMTSQVRGLNQAQRNANDGISIAQTAEGGLNQVNDNLQRIRELTVQAQNGTNSASDIDSIQQEVNERLAEINRISVETDFNGTKILSTGSTLKIQVGADDGQTISITIAKTAETTRTTGATEGWNAYSGAAIDTTVSGSNINGEARTVKADGFDVRQANALQYIDERLTAVDKQRSELGAIQNRFESAITNLQTNSTNLQAARSRIEDADYAVEVANMSKNQILQQAGTSVLAQANQIPQGVLSLLR